VLSFVVEIKIHLNRTPFSALQLVSEVGFMMEDETLQVILQQFVELKTDISAMSVGQEELKNDKTEKVP
jgi:hypothetical protein